MLKDLKWTSCLSYVPLLAAALGMFPFAAHANPTGGTVTTGQATISEAGTKLTVNQQSDKAVIDWRGFNVAAGEWTQFNQPSSSSIALNRVNSTSASQIDGKVTANGNIIIINQNGVVFGAGSQVDVNGLIATTADVGNDSFMNSTGKITFDKAGNANASVINNGTITAADAGLVGLVAPNVINNGTITAKLGKVQLASGDTATVDMYGDSLMEVAVSDNVKSQLVSNTGKINAAGGKIALTAAAGKNIVNSLITVKGELKAPAVSQKNGEIYIFAAGSNAVKGNVATAKNVQTGSSTVLVSAIIDVSGKNTGEQGGKISLLGDNVSLLSGTILDASGDIGGGTIKVGGDFHGGGDTATALNTTVQSGTTINADAITSGNGGNVAVWSDGYTQFAGAISARGGVNAGDGGYVETSGKGTLTFRGTVDTQAPNGNDGMLLLDPTTITVLAGTGDGAADGTTTFNGNGTAGTVNSSDTLATIYQSELQGISATTNIYLQASNGITINSLSGANLNLAQTAGHSVTFDAGAGAFTMQATDKITTANGALNIITGGGSSTIGNLTTGSGAITFNIAGTATDSGVINTSGGISMTGTGTLSLSGANTYTGGTNINAGILNFTNGALGSSGNITFGGGTLQYASGNTQDISSRLKNSTAGAITIDTVNNNVTYASIIDSSNTAGLTLNSTGTGVLTLSGANTFTGSTNIKAGTLSGQAATAFSGSTIYLGDTSGNANATLGLNVAGATFANAVVVNSGNSGTATITDTAAPWNCTLSGTITNSGAHDLVIDNELNAHMLTFSNTVDVAGTITNIGSNTGSTIFSSNISSNVTGVIQNSATSSLTLSGNNAFGSLTVKAGTVIGTNANAYGAGTITLGDSVSNSSAVNLQQNSQGLTISNKIVLADRSTATGHISIINPNNDTVAYSGGVTGNNDLYINNSNNNTNTITFSGSSLNNNGTINNVSTGNGTVTISANIGNNVTGITQNSTTAALTVSGGISVNSGGTTLTNSSGTKLLTISGSVTGTGDLIINNNSSTANGVTLSNSINNTGNVTNSGTGSGTESIASNIGSNVTSVIENSSNSALTLSGSNAFNGLTIKSGMVTSTSNANSIGTGTITVGDSAGNNSATLVLYGNATTFTNAFNIASGNTGAATINMQGYATTIGGTVTLNNHDLTIGTQGNEHVTGNIVGTGNLVINSTLNNSNGTDFSSINMTGTITNSSNGGGTSPITLSSIDSNVQGVIQNSSNSLLILTNMNNFNQTISIQSGVLRAYNISGGATGVNIVVGSPGGSADAVFDYWTSVGKFAVPITVESGSGQRIIDMGANWSSMYTPITLKNNLTIVDDGGSQGPGSMYTTITTASGTTNLTIANNNPNANAGNVFTFYNPININGTITNSGTGGSVVISGNIGSNVTGVTENSTTSGLTLSGTNSYVGPTTITAGTLKAGAANVLGGANSTDALVMGGGTLDMNGYTQAIGSLTGTGSITSNAAGTFALNVGYDNTSPAAYSGTILTGSSTAFSLNKVGTGTLTLSGANTYTGGTTITNGILNFTSGSLGSSGNLTFAGGTLQYASGNTQDISSRLKNSTAGAITIDTVNNNVTYASIIDNSNTAGLTLNSTGTGTLTLSGNNTFTGGLTIKSGTVASSTNANSIGAGTITLGDSAGSNSATLVLNGNGTTFTNAINVASGNTGAASILMQGWNPIIGGTVTLNNHDLTIGTQGGQTVAGSIVGTGNLVINATGNNVNGTSFASVNMAGTITNSNSGGGTTPISITSIDSNVQGVIQNSSNSTLILSHLNNFNQTININSGTVLASNANNGGAAGMSIVIGSAGGSSNAALAIASATITAAVTVESGSGNRTIDVGAQWDSLSGSIALKKDLTILDSASNASPGSVHSTITTASGTTNLTIANNNPTANASNFLIFDNPININGTITNSGTGGSVVISGAIGSSVTGVIENSATSALTLSGNNAFNGLTIKSGTVIGSTSANAFGTGSITLGDTSGSANATLQAGSATNFANAIVLNSGNTGTDTIGDSGNYAATFSGGVTGTHDLTINNTGTSTLTFATGHLNNTGIITNASSGSGGVTISTNIDSNVTGITENSTTSALTVSGGLTVNGSGTTLTDASGAAALTVSGGINGTGNLIINNNSSTANGITFSINSINNTGTVTNSGTGTGSETIGVVIGSNVTGVTENSTTSALTVSGGLTVNSSGTTLTDASGAAALNVTGGITGTGSLVLNNNSNTDGNITLSGSAINNVGTITNSGTGTGVASISAAIGSKVTGIIENSTTSALNVSGAITVGASGMTLTNNNSSGTSLINVSGGVAGNGNLTINNNSSIANGILIFGSAINNAGTVTNSGTGTGNSLISANIGSNVTGVTENSTTSGLNLSGTGTYNGPTLVNAGTLTLGANNALSSSSAVTVASGATLDLHGYNDTVTSMADNGTVTFGSNNTLTTTGSQTYTGNVTGSGITLTSGGTITANNALNNLTGNVTITASGAASIKNSGSLSLGAVSAGTFFGQALGGNLTLSAPVVVTGTSSNALVLVTNANFINNAGSNALQTGVGGNWLVYSTDPTDDTVSGNIAGGLANDYRRFSCTYGGSCPALGTGNGLLYSYTPNLTATASGVTLTYGDAAPNLTGYNYTLSGYLGSDSGADHVTGSVNGTTNYTSTSNVGSYGITYANGSLASSMGYNIVVAPTNNTAITVNKAHLTVTADNQSRSYGSADPSFTDTITGFVNGQNISVVSGSAGNSTPGTDTATSAAGNTYAITASLGSLSATNYDFTVFNPGTLTITKANLTITATGGVSQTYGSVNLGTTGFTTSALQNGETVGAVTLTAVDTHGNGVSGSGNLNVGNYNIQGSAATGGTFNANNYNITYTAATDGLTVTQKALTVTGLTAASRSYTGLTDETLGGVATLSGLVSGSDHVTLGGSATGTFANANVGTSKVVTIAGNTISGTDTGNYSFTQQAPLTADITKASLTITANGGVSQTYGSVSLGNTGFTTMGLQNGETVGTVTLSAVDVHNNGTSTSGNLNVGNYNIQGSAATGGTFNTNNYAITYTAAANGLTVTQKALTVSGLAVNDKTYDSTTGATVSNYGSLASGGVVGSDNVILNHAAVTATFDNANAGTTHVVSTSGYALNSGNGNGDASNYSLTQPVTAANVTINKASLTITSANQTQTYGFGGNSAALNGGSYGVAGTLYGTDSVTGVTFLTNDTTSSSGNYKAGTYTLTASNAAGSGLSNYNIAYTTNNAGLLVNQAVLTVTGLAINAKTYDSTTDGTSSISNYGSLAAGVIGADSVSLNHSAVTATFDNANAGTTHVVSASGYALNSGNGNGDASNYIITQPVTASNVTINKASLTVTADNRTKGYGDTDPTFTYTTNGLKGSDTTANVLSGGLTRDAGENVGNYAINQGTLSANNNYTLTYVPGTLAITTAHIAAVIADNQTMTYGSAAPLLTYSFSGLVNGDNGSVFTGALATTATSSSNVGTYAITLGTLSAGANYTIDFTGGHVSVTPATLTVAANAGQHKTYGAIDPTLTYSYNGLVNGDQSTIITGGLTRAAGEAVANGPYAINLGTLSAGGNYTINYTGSTFAINAANLTITATGGVSQTYGSVNLGTTGFTANGLQNGENIGAVTLTAVDTHGNGVSGSGNLNVGNYNIQGSAATGGSFTASNYNITYAAATDGLTVTQKALTVSGLTATSRSYNGLTSDALGGTAALSGLVSNNDHVTLGGTAVGTFADANAAFGKTVTISGNTISGNDIGNYSFTQEAPLTADITKANLTITANGGVSQTYGSVNLGTTGFTSVGLQNGESIGGVTLAALDTHANGVSSSNNLNVGSYTIAASNASGGTFSNANYNIGYISATDGLSVTKKALTVSGVAVTGKTYDGNTDDTSGITSYGNLTGGGVIGIDSVNLNHNAAIATFDNANAGNNHNVTVTGYTLTNTDAGNYSVTAPIASNVVITPKALTVSANNISVNYGSIDPALTYSYNGLVGGDTSANFTGALARVAGSNAGNYDILQNTLAATGNYTIGSYTSGVFTITGVGAPVTTNNIIIPDTVTAESQKPVITTVNFNPLIHNDKPTIVLASSPTGNGKVYTPINSDISVDILPSLSPSVGNNKKDKKTDDENCNIKVNGKPGASGAGCSTSIE